MSPAKLRVEPRQRVVGRAICALKDQMKLARAQAVENPGLQVAESCGRVVEAGGVVQCVDGQPRGQRAGHRNVFRVIERVHGGYLLL
ncbi:hypothetical protein BTH42_28790 [Burkholderia sp. SRS-W-2-2016]|nr:hypothetical protein BTH42_28790 [Burkholderia sp. SRS-W-2-2016]